MISLVPRLSEGEGEREPGDKATVWPAFSTQQQ